MSYNDPNSTDIYTTIDYSADTITIDPSACTIGIGAGTNNWTTMATGAIGASPYTIGGNWATSPYTIGGTASNSISINGENADIKINGRSIVDVLDRLEQQMGWLTPKPEIEKEWAELKRLGDEYRAMEADIKDKMKVWDILNKPID